MLIDLYTPGYQFAERHEVLVRADPDRTYSAVKRVRARDIPIVSLLFALRALDIRRLFGKAKDPTDELPIVEAALSKGFVRLEDDPPRELVLGIIGQFWRIRGGPAPVVIADAEAFRSMSYAGCAKAVMNFWVEPASGQLTKLVTETRISAGDAATRRRFAVYWLFIRLGSGLIRRLWLRAIRRSAESNSAALNPIRGDK